MTYVAVFDIADEGYKSLSFPAFGLILVALGIILVLLRRHIPRWSERGTVARLIFPYGFLCLAILWTLVTFVNTYGDYRAASSARQDNSFRVVEGVVTEFKPMPATGHAMESFCVSGVCFYYSDYVVTAGFNQTSSHGGPIRDGLPVRVTYIGNTIVKLEVAK
jgi:hypothetical protein